ncbi:hypothetical protein KBJ98_13850 [Flavobacterium sp. F-328]|uniref:Uncharacterized protein n=1 Tax=Flavobacterium erciyesense TaxID=2825842 RepID=A0ABS5D717_9FLAO|nr:hypothetical protein [Flavobacterium erciyesense]MBQ0909793.1 hypothetical protein [Flavobacterium erciyesense]
MNCEWLKEILNQITVLSKTDWSTEAYENALRETSLIGIEEDEDFYGDVFLSHFENEIQKFEEDVLVKYFEYLHLSIIAGECFLNDFLDTIKKTIAVCGRLQYVQFKEGIDEKLLLSLEGKIEEIEPLSILKKCLIEYQSNSKFLLRLVENPSLNTLFDLSDQTQDILEELKNSRFINDSDLKKELLLSIKNNLILLRKDFYLKYDIEDLKSLLISKNELESCNKYFKSTPAISNILILLIEKSTFLIRKFIIRKYKEEDVHNENYVFLGKESNFDFVSHKLQFDVFKDWDRYSKNHFLSEDNYEKSITLNRNSQKILKIGKVSALDFHALTKCYKDLNTDLNKLKELLTEIDSIPIDNIVFDSFSLNKIKNYISNNVFSEAIRNISFDLHIDEIEMLINGDIKKIQKIQDESFLNNFFPYYKICDFLNNYIEIKISEFSLNNKDSEDSIKQVNKSLDLLKKYFDFFKRFLKWSKVHLNYSYQLPFRECLKKHVLGDKIINVFSSATFSLPIEFEKYDEFEKYTEASILRVENEIKSLSNLNSIMKHFEKDRDELQEDIKSNSKKNIELLGIFSAIIALLFQGAYTSNSSVPFDDKLYALLIMFVVLISFLLMLRSFVSKKYERNELITVRIISFLVIPILLIVVIIILKIFK